MSDRFAENPTKPENSKAYGGLHIVRMAPGDQSISLDFEYYGSDLRDAIKGEYEIYVEIDDLESGKKNRSCHIAEGCILFSIYGFKKRTGLQGRAENDR